MRAGPSGLRPPTDHYRITDLVGAPTGYVDDRRLEDDAVRFLGYGREVVRAVLVAEADPLT